MSRVLASYFKDRIGCRDNNLYDGKYYYAELSTNPYAKKLDYAALGNLPFGHKLNITYKNKTLVASKGDVGAGGPKYPKIDLHYTLAQALNFISAGLDYVTISDA